MNDTGGPAFPTIPENYMGMDPPGEGMTMRDYFAAKAMQAWISRGDDSGENGIAKWAYEMADAMLKARQP